MKKADPAAAVLADRITLAAPGEPGPNALIATLIPQVLRAAVLAVGHDGDPASAACAGQLARHAVHGGFATDRGHTWNAPAIHQYGPTALPDLLAAAAGDRALAAMLTTTPGTGTVLRLYTTEGDPVTEAGGLGALRARLARDRPALPVNAHSLGTIIDHTREGDPS